MTKPREKNREELQAEIEDGKKKIRQLENREKVLRQKLSQEERRTRSHRLIVRGAVFESIVPEAKTMTDEEAAAFLRLALTSEEARGLSEKTHRGREKRIIPLAQRAHYPRYSTIRGNFQIVAIYKDFKEISSDNVTTILESPATDSPFSVLQNFPFAGRTISRSNPGYACSQSPVKAQRTVRS